MVVRDTVWCGTSRWGVMGRGSGWWREGCGGEVVCVPRWV